MVGLRVILEIADVGDLTTLCKRRRRWEYPTTHDDGPVGGTSQVTDQAARGSGWPDPVRLAREAGDDGSRGWVAKPPNTVVGKALVGMQKWAIVIVMALGAVHHWPCPVTD